MSVRLVAQPQPGQARIDQFLCFRLSRTFPPSPPFPAVTTLASSHDVLIGYTGKVDIITRLGGEGGHHFLNINNPNISQEGDIYKIAKCGVI